MMPLTKREKIFLIVCGILVFIFAFIPQETLNDYEPLILIFIGFPLGLMIATDPERIRKQ
jgi:hypothetical protein